MDFDALGPRMEGGKSAKNRGRYDLRLFIDGSRMLNYLHWLKYFPSLTLSAIKKAYGRLSAEEYIHWALINDSITG